MAMTTITTSWTDISGGDFNAGSNWNNGVPTVGDTALITAPGTYTVTSAADNVVGILQMQSNATLDLNGALPFIVTAGTGGGTGALAGTIAVNNGASFVLGTDGKSTTFNNTGTISLDATGNPTGLVIAGKVTLTGAGTVTLSDPINDLIESDGTAATLTNGSTKAGNTISGAGVIGDPNDSLLTFINAKTGVVDADSAAGLFIDPAGGSATNDGLMETSGAGKLTFGGDNQSTIINNIGTISLNSSGIGANLVIAGTVTFTGKGKVTLTGSSPVLIVSDGTAATLTNGNSTFGNTINGAGTIGDASDGLLEFNNEDRGIVDATGDLVINTDNAIVSNNGLMEATGSGDLIIESRVDQLTAGAHAISGEIKAATAGAAVTLEGVTISGGQLATVKGSFISTGGGGASEIVTTVATTNAGQLGAEGGNLTVTGPVDNTGTLDANGYILDLAGTVSGSGHATINNGGTLEFGVVDTGIAQAVTFTNSGAGTETLQFDAAASRTANLIYHGTITGLAATNDVVDFAGLQFENTADPVTTKLSGSKTIVTVAEGTDAVSFTVAGNYFGDSFTVSQDSGTGTQIVLDPPAAPASASYANTNLLVQSLAAFGTGNGTVESGGGSLTEHLATPGLLAATPHWHRG